MIVKKHYVFGPIASRRLGISLGIDLVPPKTCPQNCVYCEAGATTNLTLERREYVPVDTVITELDEVLAAAPKLDFITFSGSGEPTLNSGIGRVIRHLKRHYPQYRVCLLTNAMLLDDPALCRDLAELDLVVPSLDASCAAEFEAVNRPGPGADFDRFVAALTRFTHQTPVRVELEIFIVPGVNDSDASIARFVELTRGMRLDAIQLNTLDRPGAVAGLHPSAPDNTRRFIRALSPYFEVEAVGPFRYRTARPDACPVSDPERRIIDLITRRPATVPDLALALGRGDDEVRRHLDDLFKRGLVAVERRERGDFYLPAGPERTAESRGDGENRRQG